MSSCTVMEHHRNLDIYYVPKVFTSEMFISKQMFRLFCSSLHQCNAEQTDNKINANSTETTDMGLWAYGLNFLQLYSLLHYIRECVSTLYVGMPQKQNGRPIHCIA